jgi:hypothetical protein
VSSYTRPEVEEQTYRDARGAVIAYGDRWGSDGPPEDSYSVDTHPQRFAPLHAVAEALIESLTRDHDVEVIDDPSCAGDLLCPQDDVVRAVRVRPAAEEAAPLTFVFTGYPAVIVHAGLIHDFVFPPCGCDACDETWQSAADELERVVRAVVSGRYREAVREDRGELWVGHELAGDDGSRSRGKSLTADLDGTLSAARRRLISLPDGWRAWPTG